MITLTSVFGSALLTEPNELKVVETECWSENVLGPLFALSLLSHTAEGLSLYL